MCNTRVTPPLRLRLIRRYVTTRGGRDSAWRGTFSACEPGARERLRGCRDGSPYTRVNGRKAFTYATCDTMSGHLGAAYGSPIAARMVAWKALSSMVRSRTRP